MVAALAALLFPALGAAPLERAEIYFLDAARGMVESGDWLVPRYRGEPFFDKPPLAYWLMAASMPVLGFTPAAGRAVSAVAALLTVVATAALGVALLGRRSALAGAAVLATTVAFASFGRVAMADMLLALWSTLAVALALRAQDGASARWALPATGLVLALGFLTKGPIALLLPGLGLALLHGRGRVALPIGPALAGLALTVLVGGAWFAAVHARLGAEPLAHFFFRENLERFAGETYDAGRPVWYYAATYLGEGLPWSLFLLLSVFRFLKPRGTPDPARPATGFLLGWMGLMLVPLSLSRGKIDYYLLPLYPAASLAVGHAIAAVPWGRLERGWARVVLLVSAAGFALVPFVPSRIAGPWLPPPGVRLALLVVAASAAAACLAAVFAVGPRRTLAVLAGGSALVFGILATSFVPAFVRAQPFASVVADTVRERRYRPDAALVYCEDPSRVQREILFRARLAAEQRCDLWNPASSRRPYLLLLQPGELASLSTVPGLRVVSEHSYLPATALTLRGLLEPPQPMRLVLAANYATDDPIAEIKRKRDRRRALRAEP